MNSASGPYRKTCVDSYERLLFISSHVSKFTGLLMGKKSQKSCLQADSLPTVFQWKIIFAAPRSNSYLGLRMASYCRTQTVKSKHMECSSPTLFEFTISVLWITELSSHIARSTNVINHHRLSLPAADEHFLSLVWTTFLWDETDQRQL